MPVRASAQAVTSTRMRITPRGCQTSESDLAAIANTPAPAKLDGVVITCHDVPLKCSSRGPVPLVPPTHTSAGESATTDSKSVPLGPDNVELGDPVHAVPGVVITESNRAWKPGPPQRPGRALAWYLTASDGRRKTPATGALRLMHG